MVDRHGGTAEKPEGYDDFKQFDFEEPDKGWDLMSRVITSNRKTNKVWFLIDKINSEKKKYSEIIGKSELEFN